MNWGYKLVLVFIVFVSAIVYMVIKASGFNNDLVVTDYYEKELVYQQVIDKVERTNKLTQPVIVDVKGKNLKLTFPPEMKDLEISAEVLVYYAADKKKDQLFQLLVRNRQAEIELDPASGGQYDVKIEWTADDITYYSTEKILVK